MHTEFWNRHRSKLKFKALLNEHSSETAAVVTSGPRVKFPDDRTLRINLNKLDFDQLRGFGAKYFMWENAFYGDPDKMASVAIAMHAFLAGNEYTYLFLSGILFHYPDVQPDRNILYKLGDFIGDSVYREVNRCMHDVSRNYNDWLSSN